MNQETPQISNCCYGSSTGDCSEVYGRGVDWKGHAALAANDFINQFQNQQQKVHQQQEGKIMADNTTRRIVQVFIADPNENVPLGKSVLYTGEQKLTDLNDTELFFEVPSLQDLIKSHNETRKVTVDMEASKRAGKDIFLDPVKIRDLRMVVVTVASF